ncbi:helix-turn-helix transcriptional regulator [Mesorhizobium sp. L2C066B000]|uniref:helix-turn-helix transcriptional regulator n=1 Tax=Mesorhizobium sp. L2C066B000 TaxID=1287105 RepID=UPI0012DE5193|nr:helix-turn-helix transcriptional regulator [Mesorhizobium sp. L2C066B000]
MSSDIADLNTIINAAACNVNRWTDVAELLQRFIPGSKILFQVVEKESTTLLQVVYSGFSDRTIQAYGDHYWKVNPWTKGMNEMNMSLFTRSSELYPDQLLRKTEFFTDLVNPERECDGATALKFAAHRDRYAVLAVHHDFRRHEQIHARGQALLRTVVPALRTALEVNRLTNPTFNRPGGRGLIDQLVDAAIVVDENCRLLASNAAANELIADASLVLVRGQDIVQINNAEANAAFAGLVRNSCTLGDGRARLDDLIVNSASGNYVVTCVPVAIDQTNALPAGLLSIFTPRTVSLVIVRPRASEDLAALMGNLRHHFGLTKAEAGLVLEFERGGTLSEIASRVGVSRSTIQTHLKSIFAKTGTSKQRDVVTLITRHRASGRLFFPR